MKDRIVFIQQSDDKDKIFINFESKAKLQMQIMFLFSFFSFFFNWSTLCTLAERWARSSSVLWPGRSVTVADPAVSSATEGSTLAVT